ncbi:hypothetical protein M404DRAFT_833904 [Pisolithus tinctorius Marx 270]|uniref:Uncharacterized protein n=1 Tax=Pisolithus tinctorius Marx 270 TaxID=870435 RepID=A0A0C3JPK1_PISTI|nr:hypothetical protein M404DRAFT_833904 [Pisolithus tinctorius Marx 270]
MLEPRRPIRLGRRDGTTVHTNSELHGNEGCSNQPTSTIKTKIIRVPVNLWTGRHSPQTQGRGHKCYIEDGICGLAAVVFAKFSNYMMTMHGLKAGITSSFLRSLGPSTSFRWVKLEWKHNALAEWVPFSLCLVCCRMPTALV